MAVRQIGILAIDASGHRCEPVFGGFHLEREADLAFVRSVVPRDIRIAIKKFRKCSFDDWMPDDPISTYEKIKLIEKLDDAQWAQPRPDARARAPAALNELVIADTSANAPGHRQHLRAIPWRIAKVP